MDLDVPKGDNSASRLLPSTAKTEVSLKFCGFSTSLELPKRAKSIDEPEIPLEASKLSKQNNLNTRSPGYKTERHARSRRENELALHRTSGRSTEKLCKPSKVRKFPFGQFKASHSVLSASFKHKAVSKAMKLGPMTYRGVLKITGELCKAELAPLKNHLNARSDLSSEGQDLLHVIAAAHPKCNPMIRALPTVVNLVPRELKAKLMNEKNVELLKIGVFLANKWISRSA
jgi:hypothetical protein